MSWSFLEILQLFLLAHDTLDINGLNFLVHSGCYVTCMDVSTWSIQEIQQISAWYCVYSKTKVINRITPSKDILRLT